MSTYLSPWQASMRQHFHVRNKQKEKRNSLDLWGLLWRSATELFLTIIESTNLLYSSSEAGVQSVRTNPVLSTLVDIFECVDQSPALYEDQTFQNC